MNTAVGCVSALSGALTSRGLAVKDGLARNYRSRANRPLVVGSAYP